MPAIPAEPDSVYAIVLCYGQGDAARQVMRDDPRLLTRMGRGSAHAYDDEPASPSLTRRMPSTPQQHPAFLPDPSSGGRLNTDTPLPSHEYDTYTDHDLHDDNEAQEPLVGPEPSHAMGGPLGETATPDTAGQHSRLPDAEAAGQQLGFTPQGNAHAALFAQEGLPHGQTVVPHFVPTDFDEEPPLAAPAQAEAPANEHAFADGHPSVEPPAHDQGVNQDAQHALGDDASDDDDDDDDDAQDGPDVAQEAVPPAYADTQGESEVQSADTARGLTGAHDGHGEVRTHRYGAGALGASIAPEMPGPQTERGADALQWIYDRFSLQGLQRNVDDALIQAVTRIRRLERADDTSGVVGDDPGSTTATSGRHLEEKRSRGSEFLHHIIASVKRKSFRK